MKLKSILLMSAGVLTAAAAQAQTHVTTNGQKYVLVEEGTGAWCGWCPDGAQALQQQIEATNPKAIVASFHNTYKPPSYAYNDGMEIPGDPYNSGTGYITGFPMGTVDRTAFAAGGGTVGQDRCYWSADVATQVTLTPKFDVTMDCTYDPATSLLTVKITGKALVAGTGTWNVNAYVVEDSILSSGGVLYAQKSYLDPATSKVQCTTTPSWFIGMGSPISPSSNYAHMNVVEKILCSGGSIWGETLFTNPTLGQTASKTYTYTVPAKFIGSAGGTGWTINYKHLKVIGYRNYRQGY